MDGKGTKGLIAITPEGTVIGGICYSLGQNDGLRATIENVAVHHDYQRNGIGRELIRSLVDKLRSEGAVEIATIPSDSSIPFYEKQGFVPDFYPLYVKKLT